MRRTAPHCIFLALLVACTSPDAPAVGVDAGFRDAGVQVDASSTRVVDAGAPVDATALPGLDAGAPLGTYFLLDDGTSIVGELLATYNHAVFWMEPSDEVSYAVYRDELFAPYPDDRSVTIVSSVDVIEQGPVTLEATPFREASRARGFVLERPPLSGVSYVITGGESYHLEEDGYGHFAIDIVRTSNDGLTYRGFGTANADYLVWDEQVRLPTGGTVVEVIRDAPDRPPGELDLDAVNNLVGVHLGGGFYLYLLHFRADTIADDVVVGERLEAGHYLGRVGNSGVSVAPHLHVVMLALDPESEPVRSWSVPLELANVYTSRSMRGRGTHRPYAAVRGGTWISARPF